MAEDQTPQEHNPDQSASEDASRSSRRDFFKKVGLVAGGMAAGGSLGFATSELVSDRESVDPVEDINQGGADPTAIQETATPTLPLDEVPPRDFEHAFTYFSVEEAAVVEALAERIFPGDDEEPGAADAGVVYYLDRQLTTGWGFGARWYMQEPFDPEGADDTQGWQYPQTPREFYRASIEFIQEHCRSAYGRSFADLSADEQDEVIQALSDDQIDSFRGIDPSDFFEVIRSATLEGVYSDPLWGGNRNMVGWTLKRYPGSRISYRDQIASEEFIELQPESLATAHGGVPAPHHQHQGQEGP